MTSLNNPISRRSFVAAAGSLAASGLIAGCANTAPAAKTGDKAKITFCLDYTPNTNHTGVYVAKHEGYFAEEGIEIEIVQPAEDSAEAMIGSGQAQLGVSYQDYIANVLIIAKTTKHTSCQTEPSTFWITSSSRKSAHTTATTQLHTS